jgi:glycosyltransferase involved in cell wall biosynthesis
LKSKKAHFYKTELLIIGSLPPPIGGVSVHVERLLHYLNIEHYHYCFFHLKKDSFIKALRLFFNCRKIHLHTSSVYLRFVVAVTSKIFGKKLILTIHGNVGRFNNYKNFFDKLAIKLSAVPIVINKKSFEKSKIVNKHTVLMSAFLPPFKTDVLTNDVVEEISRLRQFHKIIFCTNAYNLSYDKNKNEIYQVSLLVKIFSKLKEKALIISDPSGAYNNFFKEKNEKLTDNIFIIPVQHNFCEILRLSDVFLRITTTDGDSLSLKEALYFKKNVIATNVVDRPDGVILVENNYDAIASAIQMVTVYNNPVIINNDIDVLINLYNKI